MAGYKRTRTTVISEAGEKSTIIGQEGAKVPSGDVRLTVGEVEKLTGTSKDTLRFYDEKGLLCPARTGDGVANNRKLYGVDDLRRLQAIQTLRAYDFSLEEIKHILDDGVDIYEVMADKLEELRRQEARLRALILFAKFVDMTDDDLVEGLANGPASLEDLAEYARGTSPYEAALQKLDDYSEEDAAKALDGLYPIIAQLLMFDEARSFMSTEAAVSEFFSWWSGFVASVKDTGYLGFWAIFEDHGLVPEYIEAVGHPGDAGFIQMLTFFAVLLHLAEDNDALIIDIAELADTDIVAAIERAHELVSEVSLIMLGDDDAASMAPSRLVDVAYFVLLCLERVLTDDELAERLGLAEDVSFDEYIIDKALQVMAIMGDEKESGALRGTRPVEEC